MVKRTWSHKFRPTPGESTSTGMEQFWRAAAGLMPETLRSCGEWTSPPEMIIFRRAEIEYGILPMIDDTATPVAVRLLLKTMHLAMVRG